MGARLTVPNEDLIWQAACAHIGRDGWQQLVADLLRNHGKRPSRNLLRYLRREWVGVKGLEALQGALEATDLSWPAFDAQACGNP